MISSIKRLTDSDYRVLGSYDFEVSYNCQMVSGDTIFSRILIDWHYRLPKGANKPRLIAEYFDFLRKREPLQKPLMGWSKIYHQIDHYARWGNFRQAFNDDLPCFRRHLVRLDNRR